MGTRFRIYQKHQIAGTSQVVVISDLTHAELMGVRKEEGEAGTAALIHGHVWEGPAREEMTPEAYLAAPLPTGWEPERLVFSSPAEIGKELNSGQLAALATALIGLSTPADVIASFRHGRGEAHGAESGPNGAEVGSAPLVDPVRIP